MFFFYFQNSFTVSLTRSIRRGAGAPPSPATSNVSLTSHRTSPSPAKHRNPSPLSEYPFIHLVALLVDKLFK